MSADDQRTQPGRVIDRSTATQAEVLEAIRHAVRSGETLTIIERDKVHSQVITPKAVAVCTRCDGSGLEPDGERT